MTAPLVLGTVQFGMRYGIANSIGQPSVEGVRRILAAALKAGVDMLDTAVAYGESEAVLGHIGVTGWKIVSKVPQVPDNESDIAGWMKRTVESSLGMLGVDRLYGLLLHDTKQLRTPRGASIVAALEGVCRHGLASKAGVSIYDPDEDLRTVLGLFTPQIVQAPLNILDRRLVTGGWAEWLQGSGSEIHTRSAFLQGLLLMPPEDRPATFARWSAIWSEWDHWLGTTGLSPTEACLRFVRSQPDIDRCVVGVDSVGQLGELVDIPDLPLGSLPKWPETPGSDLTNPSRWSAS